MSHVYELYYQAFEAFRKVKPIQTVEDNDRYCMLVKTQLEEHLTIIPRLAMGVLECRDMMPAENIDKLMYTLLRSVRAFNCSDNT
jgi:pyruvate dehydrogenase kinase 2/3/4